MLSLLREVLSGEMELFQHVLEAGCAALLVLGALAFAAALVASIYSSIAQVLRRQQRARCFLDLLETGLNQGRSAEQLVVSLSQGRVQAMGLPLHLAAGHVENGLRLGAALDRVPAFLPASVRAMLKVGESIGDLRKVLPACRAVLQRAASAAQLRVNNLVVVLAVCPLGALVNWMFMVFVLPKFREIAKDILPGAALPGLTFVAFKWSFTLALGIVLLWLVVYLLEFMPGTTPRLQRWFGDHFWRLFHWVDFLLPWRRRRMHRDFSALLAPLLDAGVTEPQALRLAASGTANRYFLARAEGAVRDLESGMPLPEAVRRLDDAGEFRWRLRNAVQAGAGFMAALRGWHDALEAKAFQQEQAASQAITTGFVLLNGLMVSLMALGTFSILIRILDLTAL
jgi:type II secretory pathway component PulF